MRGRLGLLFVLLASPLLADDGKGRVDLPLEKYEALRAAPPEAASATVVESLRLSGLFGSRGIHLVAEGRAVGKRPEVPLLAAMEGFALRGCDGPALVQRTEPGALSLLPLAGRFRVSCAVAVEPGRERLVFVAAPAVLDVKAEVGGARLEHGEESEAGRTVVLLREVTGRRRMPVSATARYRITLQPDETDFRYELAIHNPNADRAPFVLPLASGERVERTER